MKRLLMLLALTILPAAAQAQAGFGRFHALVIGNQHYQYLTELKTPLDDARAVAEVLHEEYGFTHDLLLDKTRSQIMAVLYELRNTMTEEDNLLIYYAGHGKIDKKSGAGYWQPTDAEQKNPANWISIDDIDRQLKAIPAKHILVVADSCYSGSLLMREDSSVLMPRGMARNEWLRRVQSWRSRNALTSGGDEFVLDGGSDGHSVFASVFLKVLQENKDILDGAALFNLIKIPVIANAKQTPMYGIIYGTGHYRGDFLFVPKELQGGGEPEPPRPDDLRSILQRGKQKGRTIGQYIDHGDGTITDTKTGLMWKRCSEGLSGGNCEEGKAETYKFDDAVKRFKNVKYAGYADWRLPTIDELKTLVYCSKGKDKEGDCKDGSEVPMINQQAFPNTETGYFVWSGSPYADSSDGAWFVYFYGGNSYIYDRFNSYAVRLVRDGQ